MENPEESKLVHNWAETGPARFLTESKVMLDDETLRDGLQSPSVTDPPVETDVVNGLLRQEFIANGLFLGASLNLCLAHDRSDVVDQTVAAGETAFRAVRDALNSADPAACRRGAALRSVFAVR